MRGEAEQHGAGDHSAHLCTTHCMQRPSWGAAGLQRSSGFLLGGSLSNHISNRNCYYSRHFGENLFSLLA